MLEKWKKFISVFSLIENKILSTLSSDWIDKESKKTYSAETDEIHSKDIWIVIKDISVFLMSCCIFTFLR